MLEACDRGFPHMRRLAILSAAGLVALANVALAAGAPRVAYPSPSPPVPTLGFFEIRLGGSAQDPGGPEKGSGNLTGEFLTPKLFRSDNWLIDFFAPRFHIGGSANFDGNTSFGYAGLSWTRDLTEQLFIETSFGGAVHNGDTGAIPEPGHNALGCSPLFRESASIGWRFTPNWSVMATVEHLSNAGLCDQNRGLTNIGGRIGYRF